MSCQRPIKQDILYRVELKTSCERCSECCFGCIECCFKVASHYNLCRKLCIALVILTVVAILMSMGWIFAILKHCQASPDLDLKDVNVHAMNVYQNNTLPGTPYQVNSDITVQLKAKNFNTVKGCFTTFRRVAVSVDLKGQRLLHQVVPLEAFGLKPGETRTMTLELKGENAPLNNEIGSMLASEVQDTSAVELTLSFAARWMQNDRTAAWMSMKCNVTTKVPPTSSGGLVYRLCILKSY